MAKVVVGNVVFTSKKAAIAASSAILNKAKVIPAKLTAEDQAFMLDVLDLHPERDEKVKCGVVEIYVAANSYGGRGFFLRRVDGTTSDWSFLKCFNHPTIEQDVRRAFRTAIVSQVLTFANKAFATGPVICAVTGELIRRSEAHVDHKYPNTFSRLVEVFVTEHERVSFATLKIKPTRDHSEVTEFEDASLISRWCGFHAKHAVLQITSARENMAKGNRR